MAYKTILLHLDNEAHAPSLIKAAGDFASLHEAHLIGLFVIHPVQFYVGRARGAEISAQFTSLLVKEQLERMKRIQRIFEDETRNQNCIAEWRFVDDRVQVLADTVLQEATTVDLLILGQHQNNYLTDEITETVLLTSPVPVLVVPENHEISDLGNRVLIAWDGSIEVARAVGGAMPMLQSAEEVQVHHVRTSVDKANSIDSKLQDLANNLARHGANVEISDSVAERKDVGKEVFSLAKDIGVDCVVMGAYGHSKIRNLFLGNTTEYAMKNMSLPLLMWH